MQGVWRRVVYVGLYEAIAILVAGVALAALSDAGAVASGAVAVASSAIAVVWNLVFNHFFERWEARQAKRGRSILRRVVHAIGFEGGLIVALVPLFAWGLEVSLWHAFVMDLGLTVFFLVYTFCFNWAFDLVFGLPRSAAP